MQPLGNPYLSIFRSLVLNTPLKNHIPFIEKEYQNQAFREFIIWNRIIPLLHHSIKQQKLEKYLPGEFVEWLEPLWQKNRIRSLQLEMVIKEVITLLHREQIHPFLLKGIALAFSVYENPALRPMLDIDLLFNDCEEVKAREILMSKGATEIYTEESKHTMGLWQHIPPLCFKGVMIELHSHILASYEKGFLAKEALIINPVSIRIGELYCNAFRPEIQLFHLLVHMHKHVNAGYSRLIWLADLHFYIQKYKQEIDWTELNDLSRVSSMEIPVRKYLGIDQYLFKTEASISQPLDETEVNEFLKICRKIVPGNQNIGTLGMMSRLHNKKQKFLFIKGKLFPSVKYIKLKFKAKSSFRAAFCYPLLYRDYLYKLFRLLYKKMN